MKPTRGNILHYRMSHDDAKCVNLIRGESGEWVGTGEIYPMMAVDVHDHVITGAPLVNGHVFLRGSNPSTLWVTEAREADQPAHHDQESVGLWCWPPRE